jgi:hypothetical protein
MAWALKVAKVGDPVAKLVLIGLADHATDAGTAAWPSNAKLAEYAEASVRTVIRKLQLLQEMGLVQPGEQELVAHYPANRRPRVWDLLMVRGDSLSPQTRGDTTVTPQESPRGDIAVSPQEEVRGDTRDHLGVTTVSHKPSLEPSLYEDSLRSSSDVPSAQTLIAEWIDHCNGNRPPSRVIGQVSREIKIMLDEGIPFDDVRNGLARWHSQGLHPSALASVVHEIRTANAGQLKTRRQVQRESQIVSVLESAKKRDQQLGLSHTQPKEIT